MFKRISFLVALLMVLMIASGAYGAVTSVDGDQFTITDFKVDTNGYVYYKELTEVATTSDTVTVGETGKTFLPNISSGTITFTLPTAVAGLKYKFTSINGHATAGQGTVILSPQSTDTFVGCVSSTTTTTFAAGDDLDSPQATGDSVTIVGGSTAWYCTDREGTWVDGDS